MKAKGGDVGVEGDGKQVEGGGGAGHPQLGVVAPGSRIFLRWSLKVPWSRTFHSLKAPGKRTFNSLKVAP